MANNVCCSIEMEPRTLNQGQINHAREMAADVAQKTDTRETSAMIIEQGLGLGLTSSAVEIQEVGVEKPVEYCNQKAQNVVERPCQCSCNNNLESPDSNNIILDNVKEPVTAPF